MEKFFDAPLGVILLLIALALQVVSVLLGFPFTMKIEGNLALQILARGLIALLAGVLLLVILALTFLTPALMTILEKNPNLTQDGFQQINSELQDAKQQH